MALGTSQLQNHEQTHTVSANEKRVHKYTSDEKCVIVEAAEKAVTLDTLPLSFCFQNKGFMILAKALVQLGQRY